MKTLYKWSVDDYHQMIEMGLLEGKPVELLDEEIIEMSPEGVSHRFTNHTVVKYLRSLLTGLAEVFEAHPITLDNSEPEPDITVARLPETIYAQHHPYAEDIYWLVEIADKTLIKDLEEKSVIYARNGIPEYWVIDLSNKKLWIFTNPQNNNYQNKQELTTGIINSLCFPNINIEIDHLLVV